MFDCVFSMSDKEGRHLKTSVASPFKLVGVNPSRWRFAAVRARSLELKSRVEYRWLIDETNQRQSCCSLLLKVFSDLCLRRRCKSSLIHADASAFHCPRKLPVVADL